jgi:hypothetical protein
MTRNINNSIWITKKLFNKFNRIKEIKNKNNSIWITNKKLFNNYNYFSDK